MSDAPTLPNAFLLTPTAAPRIDTAHRRIQSDLPAPGTAPALEQATALFPQVNCYQPPIVWDRADGYQVFDSVGNQWIDFSSTAVTTNIGHGHPKVRAAVSAHAMDGLLAQFNFASEIRIQLASRLVGLAPQGCDQVYFWTVGSEAIECALRVAREWGLQRSPTKHHLLTHMGDFHGWTLGAHQLSGDSAAKPWLPSHDAAIHHLPFPNAIVHAGPTDWSAFFDQNIAELERSGIHSSDVAGFVIETMQGWGALPLPGDYLRRLREWADTHSVLVIFDEVQTGFGRTGKWFGHEHYGIDADLLCVGKGLTSSLPLAAVLGSQSVLGVLPPAAITTTHAAHPLSCAAALASLDVLEEEGLIAEAARKGEIARAELLKLQSRHPQVISAVSGLGLLNAIHIVNSASGKPDRVLASEWTWAAVRHGVMLFQTNQPTIKICPPLMIPDDALIEGIKALSEAFDSLQ